MKAVTLWFGDDDEGDRFADAAQAREAGGPLLLFDRSPECPSHGDEYMTPASLLAVTTVTIPAQDPAR